MIKIIIKKLLKMATLFENFKEKFPEKYLILYEFFYIEIGNWFISLKRKINKHTSIVNIIISENKASFTSTKGGLKMVYIDEAEILDKQIVDDSGTVERMLGNLCLHLRY